MTKHLILFAALTVLVNNVRADTFTFGNETIDIELVIIDAPQNVPDLSRTANPAYAGSIPYTFEIAKHEVTEAAFDVVAAVAGFDGEHKVAGPDKPVMVNWLQAAQFVNLLNTSQGFEPAYKFVEGTFSAWSSDDEGFDPGNSFRNRGAAYVLPDVDEWYKSAYFDSESTSYFRYTTGSNQPPKPVEDGTTPGTAVCNAFPLEPEPRGPADVFAAGGLSPYGTMAQGGNAQEWNETELDLVNDTLDTNWIVRGGSWNGDCNFADNRVLSSFANQTSTAGFRVGKVTPAPFVRGDFDRDGVLGIADLEFLIAHAVIGSNSVRFAHDLDGNHMIESDDVKIWLHELFGTWLGDANLDGEFNSSDLSLVLQAGEYEDELVNNSSWASGDWNGDGEFTTSDLILAFEDGGYEQGPRNAVVPVPEPGSLTLLMCGIVKLAAHRRRAN
ncbi:MAG: dockerin type I repeat-containing protein [Planctomycetales bacterium]|nr:dockerin type I repeat-containing protein [Planctomycetales bacterium]